MGQAKPRQSRQLLRAAGCRGAAQLSALCQAREGQRVTACSSRTMCQGARDCSYPKQVERGMVMHPPVDSITVVMTYVGLL